MNAFWESLAYFLILCPLELPVPQVVSDKAIAGIQRAAFKLDIAAPDVEPWCSNYRVEVGWCRRQYEEMKDSPHSWESTRFPDYLVANECLCFNAQAMRACDDDYWTYRHRRNRQLLVEEKLLERQQIWQMVIEANQPTCRGNPCYTSTKRRALAELRTLLGDDAFYRGLVPGPVPLEMWSKE